MAAEQSSVKEKNATEAERAVDDYYKLLYISDFEGEEFDGVVSGVMNFGIFVELENGIEKKLLEQLNRRGVLRMNLSSSLPVYDVRAVCLARGLSFSEAPNPSRSVDGSNLDTWSNLLKNASQEDLPHLRILQEIAVNKGMECLFSNIEDGRKLAQKLQEEFNWKHFIIAYNINISTQREERI